MSLSRLLAAALAAVLLSGRQAASADPALTVVQPGNAYETCGVAGGTAVHLTFKVADALPSAPTFTGPLAGNQVLRVQTQGSLSSIKDGQRQMIGKGVHASVCSTPPDFGRCNVAVMGFVDFGISPDYSLTGDWFIVLASAHRVEGKYSTSTVMPNTKPRDCM